MDIARCPHLCPSVATLFSCTSSAFCFSASAAASCQKPKKHHRHVNLKIKVPIDSQCSQTSSSPHHVQWKDAYKYIKFHTPQDTPGHRLAAANLAQGPGCTLWSIDVHCPGTRHPMSLWNIWNMMKHDEKGSWADLFVLIFRQNGFSMFTWSRTTGCQANIPIPMRR